jgi:Co/Zn/Cd efflux system component
MKKFSSIFMYALGALIALAFFILIIALVKFEIPEANEKILYLVVGALVGSFNQVANFFFGSSKGSKDKTEHIVNQTVKK